MTLCKYCSGYKRHKRHGTYNSDTSGNTSDYFDCYKDCIHQLIESLEHKNKVLWTVYGLGLQAMAEGLVFPEFEIIDEFPANARINVIDIVPIASFPIFIPDRNNSHLVSCGFTM